MAGYMKQDLTAQGANASAGLLSQAQGQEAGFVNSAPTGYQTPISRGDFTMPAGANMSYIKGVQAAKADQRSDISTNNETALVGVAQEKTGWARTDREKKRAIDDGMTVAAQNGGYSGVIDYLQTADPDRAVQFTQAKTELDQKMMQTDVMAALTPVEKAKALAEGYGVIGKMGSAILQAPAADRANMYQHVLPILKTINPDAPATLNTDAVHMFMLGAAQATPENVLFSNKQNALSAQSTIGKLQADKQRFLVSGKTDASVEVKNIDAAIQEENDKSQLAHLKLAETESSISANATTRQQKVMGATESFSKNLESGSKDFNTFLATYGNVASAMGILKKNPNDAYAQNMLARSYAMGLNKGALSEADAAIGFTAVGWADWEKKAKGWLKGDKVALNPQEVGLMINSYENLMQKKLTQQLSYESQYKNSADKAGAGLVHWEGVRLPSKQYYAIKTSTSGSVATDQSSMGGVRQQVNAAAIADTVRNPALLPQFVKKYGYDPSAPDQPQSPQGQQ